MPLRKPPPTIRVVDRDGVEAEHAALEVRNNPVQPGAEQGDSQTSAEPSWRLEQASYRREGPKSNKH
jgi:hypothetical protein